MFLERAEGSECSFFFSLTRGKEETGELSSFAFWSGETITRKELFLFENEGLRVDTLMPLRCGREGEREVVLLVASGGGGGGGGRLKEASSRLFDREEEKSEPRAPLLSLSQPSLAVVFFFTLLFFLFSMSALSSLLSPR